MTRAISDPSRAISRWEYKHLNIMVSTGVIVGALNALGKDGWELVGVDGENRILWLKRPVIAGWEP